MSLLALISTFVFGTVIGSFLNAVLWRLRTGESVAHGRSYCTTCRHTLAAADLVPLLSYLLLRGKCRYCAAPIGSQYPMVELATGFLYVASAATVFFAHGNVLGADALTTLLLYWYLMSVLVIVFVYDWRYMLILRAVTLPATGIAAVANLALGVPWISLVLGMLIGWGFFRLQIIVSRGRWVGGGDAWLGLLMGAALGWPMVVVALFIAYLTGAAVGSFMLLTRRASMQSQIPFGTFLAAATVITLLAGDGILTWYLNLLS